MTHPATADMHSPNADLVALWRRVFELDAIRAEREAAAAVGGDAGTLETTEAPQQEGRPCHAGALGEHL